MEGVQAVSVAHGGVVRRVLVYPGLSALELSKLLTSAFGLGGAACVVGFQDGQGVVIPISLASSSAAAGALLLAPGAVYRLLLTDTEDFLLPAGAHQQPQQQQQQHGTASEAGGGGITPLQPPPPFVAGAHAHLPVGVTPTSSASSVPTLPAVQQQQQQQQQEEEESRPPPHLHAWQEPLSRFVGVLGEQGVLAPEERAVLRALVEEGDIALAAAYRVAAARGGNRELLAAVCKRVAQGVLAAEGPAAGGGGENVQEEQGEMLRMLGHVVEEGLVTPEQHLQLECLVLLRHERVYGIFNAYTQTGDADAFCDALAALGDGAEALIAEAMGHEQPPRPVAPHQEEQQQEQEQEQPAPGAVRPLEEVVKTMGIRPAFQAWLLRQARAGDEFIEAALELYEFDKNEAELVDSLRRVLKVRMEQRRVELGRYLQQQQQHLGDRLLQQQRQRHQALVGAGGVGGGRARSMSMPTAPREAAAAMPPPPPPRPAAAAAPAADFASALQELTRQGRLGPGAARLLTGLHARGHEALAAAWTRFGRNGDEAALVDACQRVARVVASAAKAAAEGQGQEEQEARTTAAAAVPAVVPAEAGGDASATLTATGAARRAQTRTAILTQSLDLLLSRGSLDLRGYRALARRLQAEDAALLGALDGFLGNRDVEALLRRLAVLARPHPLPGSNGGEGGGGGGGGLNGGGRQTAAGGRLPSPIRTRVVAAAVAGATGPEAEEEETGSFATDRAVRMPPPATNPNMRRAAVAGAALEADDDQSTIATAATPTPLRVVEDGTPPEPPLRLGAEDREELLDILVSTGCLAEPERALLAAAARRGERALLGVFDAFARTQDVGRFQRSLRKYALILKAARVLNGGEGPGQGQGLPARSPIGERPRGLSDLTLDEEELLPPSEEGLGNVAKQLGSLSLAPLAGGEGQQEAGGGK